MKKLYTKKYKYNDLVSIVNSLIIDTEKRVIFSMFNSDNVISQATSNSVWYVKAPDVQSIDPILHGQVQFMIDYWRVSDEPILSKVYNDPTWADIINACNDMLQGGDESAVFLEGMDLKTTLNDLKTYEFIIGS
jgi:hypothetical protein